MATTPGADLIEHLTSELSSWVYEDTNIFPGKEVPPGEHVPAECIFVLDSGGPGREAMMSSTEEECRSAVQVIYRNDPNAYAQGLTRARAVRDAIHHKDITGYTDVRVMQAEPIYVGELEQGHHRWTINVEMLHYQARS